MASALIWVNGLEMQVSEGTRLDVLLELLEMGAGLKPTLVSVNAQYVPAEEWSELVLRAGCRVETVTL